MTETNFTNITAWIIHAVEDGNWWPSEEGEFSFENRQILFRPEDDDSYADFSMEYLFNDSRINHIRVMRRFFSVLAWLHDRKIKTIETGGSHRTRVSKPGRIKVIGREPLVVPSSVDKYQQLALALYRSALGEDYSPLSFVEYFRILEIKFKGKRLMEWIKERLNTIKQEACIRDYSALESLEKLGKEEFDIPHYLSVSCRHASAHGKHDPRVNPDEPGDTWRIGAALPLIKYLAERFIEKELQIDYRSTVNWIPTEGWSKSGENY